MTYCVFESTNMRSTHAGGRIYDAIADVDIENGTVGYLEGLADGETQIYNFVAGTKEGKALVVVDQPAWDYDTSKTSNQRKDKFIAKAGIPFRVRRIYADDKFAVSIDGFTQDSKDKVDKDAIVTVDPTTGKFIAKEATVTQAKADAKEAFVGTIIYKRLQGATLVTQAHTYGYSRELYTIEVAQLA